MNQQHLSTSFASAKARRLDPYRVEVCWEPKTVRAKVSVCDGRSPHTADPPISVKYAKPGCVAVSGLDPLVRYYYRLADGEGNRITTAERRIPFEGAVNLRDIGGYAAQDGRRIKWGKVFRSDGLARLTDRDQQLFLHLGIKRVYDFRTRQEAAEAPDRLPGGMGIEYINLPVTHGRFDFVEALKRLKDGDLSWLTPDFMLNGYISNLEEFGHVWGEVINHLAVSDGPPILFHCTGGKDRTGTCAALILMLLGVPEETVIDDHQLSNIYIAELLPKIFKMMASYGVDPDTVFPYLTAPRECIVAVLDYIRANYGSPAEYLVKKAGVSIKNQGFLKRKLLV